MNYEEFKQEMQDRLSNDPQIGEKLVFKNVLKNNGLELDGISMIGEGAQPVIYVQNFYAEHEEGADLESCVAKAKDLLIQAQEQEMSFQTSDLTDYDWVKPRMCLQAVSKEGNEERLKGFLYVDKGEVALIARAEIMGLGDGIGYMNLPANFPEMTGVAKETILSDLMEIAPKNAPYKFQSMTEVLSEMTGMPPEMLGIAQKEDVMYVLTNEQKLNGAATMYYPGVMDEIAEKFPGKELAIIPSSIHECLIVPCDKADREMAENLRGMIGEVNQNEVLPDEVLGTKPFIYDSVTQEIVPMIDQINEKEEIRQMVIRAGLRPTESVVNGIREARFHTGEKLTLKDIADLHRQKAERKALKPEAEAAVEKVAEQCKAQQLAQRAARTPDVPIQ